VRIAFKEWSVVVDALATGTQIVLLRKGGIAEPRGGFRVEHERFLLFPTQFHQQRDGVVAASQIRFDQLQAMRTPQDDSRVRIAYSAEMVAWRKIPSLEIARRLEGQHIWQTAVIESRFDWGREAAIYAMALRVWSLPKSVELSMLPSYGGCRSWIELGVDVDDRGGHPVLSEAEFGLRLEAFDKVLSPE